MKFLSNLAKKLFSGIVKVGAFFTNLSMRADNSIVNTFNAVSKKEPTVLRSVGVILVKNILLAWGVKAVTIFVIPAIANPVAAALVIGVCGFLWGWVALSMFLLRLNLMFSRSAY